MNEIDNYLKSAAGSASTHASNSMWHPVLLALELGLPRGSMMLHTVSDVVRCVMSYSEKIVTAMPPALLTTTHNKGGNNTSVAAADGWWLVALPPMLRSHRGTVRVHLQCPSFIVLLLEALLKESVRSNHMGDVSRKQFCFLLEAVTLVLPDEDDARQSSFSSLVNSARVTLDYVEGSHRALLLAAAMIFSGIAPPAALLPCIRRRIQELKRGHHELWTAEVAAMVCLSLFDSMARHQQQSPAVEPLPGATGPSTWVTLRRRESSLSYLSSSRGPSPRNRLDPPSLESREGSPTTPTPPLSSGGGISSLTFSSRDSMSTDAVPFPEKLPTVVTTCTSVVISCAILSTTTPTVQPALSLGQWCLNALQSLPLTITACALTQLIAKFPKAFRVSTSANEKSVRFCDAVIGQCCRIITTLFERRVQHGVHGPARSAASTNAPLSCFNSCAEEDRLQGAAQHEDIDDAIYSVEVMPCFLLLCLEAINSSRGLLLSTESQAQLGKLYVYVGRLYVSHHNVIEEERARAKSVDGMSDEAARQRFRSHDAMEQVLRGTLRAVDAVLHDYDAGTPETLRRALVLSSAPHSTLLQRIVEFAGERHEDLLATILAAADSELDDRIRHFVASDEHPQVKSSSQKDQAATVLFSLVGWLPASSEAPTLCASIGPPSSTNHESGGLTVRQKMWVTKRMVEYFRREWFAARLGVQVLSLPSSSANDGAVPVNSGGALPSCDTALQQCMPQRGTFFSCSSVTI